jgi:hypothetical protein
MAAVTEDMYPTPPLALGLTLQGCEGSGFVVKSLGHRALLCADAPPFSHQQDADYRARQAAKKGKREILSGGRDSYAAQGDC